MFWKILVNSYMLNGDEYSFRHKAIGFLFSLSEMLNQTFCPKKPPMVAFC